MFLQKNQLSNFRHFFVYFAHTWISPGKYFTIETKIISTFLWIFTVQKIINSFVVLITWLTCTFACVYISEKIAFTWQNISAYRVFHARRILRLLRISRTSFYTRLSSGSAFSRMEDAKRFPCSPMAGKRSSSNRPCLASNFRFLV